MFVTFNPRSMVPNGVSHSQPNDEYFAPITKEDWIKFVTKPHEFIQYEAVRLTDGSYQLQKAKDKSYTLLDRFFPIKREPYIFLERFDIFLLLDKPLAKASIKIDPHLRAKITEIDFFICKNNDPDLLYETLTFKGEQAHETDIMERLSPKEISVFGSFRFNEVRYAYSILE